MSNLEFFSLAQASASVAADIGHHAPSIADIVFPLANFLIYAFILKKFALPLVRDYLRSRRQEMMTAIQGAAESKQRAEAVVQEYNNRLAGADREAESILSALQADGEQEKSRILDEARSTAAKIKEDSQLLANQEIRMARQRIRLEMAQQAEAVACALIQRNLSNADQVRLVEDFMRDIGRSR